MLKSLTMLLMCAILLSGCGNGGGDSIAITPVTYTGAVQEITIKGDSMAAGLYIKDGIVLQEVWWKHWESVENNGISGASLDYLIDYAQDHRALKTVIVWAGFNTLKHPEYTVAYAIGRYSAYLNTLTYSHLVCVGVPYSDAMSKSRIAEFNAGIKPLCQHFIDASKVETIDGVHPTPYWYNKIGERISHELKGD